MTKQFTRAIAVALAFAAFVPSQVSAAISRVTGPGVLFNEPRAFVRFDAAFDTVNRVFLVVWGTQANGPVNGMFLNEAGAAITGAFAISERFDPVTNVGPLQSGWARVTYSQEQGKFLVSYVKIRADFGANAHEKLARFVTYTSGGPVLGATETFIDRWRGPAGTETGLTYSPESNLFLVTWWRYQGALPMSFVTAIDAAGNVVSTLPLTTPLDGQSDPEIACDSTTRRCLVVGWAWGMLNAGKTALWGRFITDTGVPEGADSFYLPAAGYLEEPTVAFGQAGNVFLIGYVSNGQIMGNTASPSTLGFSGSYFLRQSSAATVPLDGGGYGFPTVIYNPGTKTFLLSSTPWMAFPSAQEIDANGAPIPGTPTWGPAPTASTSLDFVPDSGANYDVRNKYTMPVPNALSSQFLLLDNHFFAQMRVSRYAGAPIETLPTTAFVTVVPGAGGLRLRWAAVAGASSYTIRRIDANGTQVVATGVTSTTFLDTSGIPAMGVQYTITAVNGSSESVARPILIPWGSAGSRTPTVMTPQDYDGDGRTDITVYRSSSGEWLSVRSSTGTPTGWWWGAPAYQDQPVPADYDGDGRADVAVYRRSTGEWFIHRSSDNVNVHQYWGSALYGDLPVPADYDGDGRADIAVYRGATGGWFILRSSAGFLSQPWGSPDYADVPVPGDYDGDGKADIAVYRSTTGEWLVRRSTNGELHTWTWGNPAEGDVPVPADFDGDRVMDMSVYRTGTGEWFVVLSGGGMLHAEWGSPGSLDIPVAADYDGDGKADVAVYRFSSGEWYIRRSSNGTMLLYSWGNTSLVDSVRVF
jgi:hypothetical protein